MKNTWHRRLIRYMRFLFCVNRSMKKKWKRRLWKFWAGEISGNRKGIWNTRWIRNKSRLCLFEIKRDIIFWVHKKIQKSSNYYGRLQIWMWMYIWKPCGRITTIWFCGKSQRLSCKSETYWEDTGISYLSGQWERTVPCTKKKLWFSGRNE